LRLPGVAGRKQPEAQLLYALTKLGFATLRVEKTGAGDSQGPPCYSEAGGIEQEVDGYRAAVAASGAKDVFLFGHSAGASLAPLVARGLPVRAIALNGAMSGGFFDYVVAMRRREAALAGTPSEAAIHERCLRRLLLAGVYCEERLPRAGARGKRFIVNHLAGMRSGDLCITLYF